MCALVASIVTALASSTHASIASAAQATSEAWQAAADVAGGTQARQAPNAPRLVVAIVVDQLRTDYLTRFREHFGPGGFNRFFRQGAAFPAARYTHAVTKTCAGHAVVLTGSHADANGIIGNDWYDPIERREIYCALDDSAPLIGVEADGRSPRNLRVSTVGDELRLATAGRSRVVTVAGKDRSAIMLGGHLAHHVYWTQDTLFTTSSYYRRDLPAWVRDFNASGAVSRYFGTKWERMLPADAYAELGADDVAGETDEAGLGRTFPHPLGDLLGASREAIDGDFVEAFEHSALHNEVVIEFATRAVVEVGLGRDSVPDLLGVGLSANDRVGHWFGPNSHEVLDVTVRTDRLLEQFLDFLDREIGLGRVLVVLTADHGVAPLPEMVERLSPVPGEYRVQPSVIEEAGGAALEAEYGDAGGDGWVLYHGMPYVYLNERALARKGVALAEAERVAVRALRELDVVHAAYSASELRRLRDAGVRTAVMRSFDPERSGHVFYTPRPNVLVMEDPTGTTHGSPWSYDTQVPVLWLGPGIRAGEYYSAAAVADIAPTLAALLGVVEPAGSRGRVLREMLTDTASPTSASVGMPAFDIAPERVVRRPAPNR